MEVKCWQGNHPIGSIGGILITVLGRWSPCECFGASVLPRYHQRPACPSSVFEPARAEVVHAGFGGLLFLSPNPRRGSAPPPSLPQSEVTVPSSLLPFKEQKVRGLYPPVLSGQVRGRREGAGLEGEVLGAVTRRNGCPRGGLSLPGQPGRGCRSRAPTAGRGCPGAQECWQAGPCAAQQPMGGQRRLRQPIGA